MKTFKFVVGIICAIVAVLAGGCGILITGSGIDASMRGHNDYGTTMAGLIMGILPAIIFGLLSWLAFKSAKKMP